MAEENPVSEDRRKAAEYMLSKLSPEQRKAVRVQYGDDLLTWERDYWKGREEAICARAKKLEKFGVKVGAMTQHFAEIIRRRLSNGGGTGTGSA